MEAPTSAGDLVPGGGLELTYESTWPTEVPIPLV